MIDTGIHLLRQVDFFRFIGKSSDYPVIRSDSAHIRSDSFQIRSENPQNCSD
jgi:hypothetical protein